jgi:hypothetical protein
VKQNTCTHAMGYILFLRGVVEDYTSFQIADNYSLPSSLFFFASLCMLQYILFILNFTSYIRILISFVSSKFQNKIVTKNLLLFKNCKIKNKAKSNTVGYSCSCLRGKIQNVLKTCMQFNIDYNILRFQI